MLTRSNIKAFCEVSDQIAGLVCTQLFCDLQSPALDGSVIIVVIAIVLVIILRSLVPRASVIQFSHLDMYVYLHTNILYIWGGFKAV